MTLLESPDAEQRRVVLPRRPLTLDDWDILREADPSRRFELVDGSLIVVAPPRSNHAVIVAELTHWLITHGFPVDRVLANMAVATGDAKGRIPDIVVLHKAVPDTTHLQPSDVILVVEVVSEGSKAQDRLVKPVEYGRAGIPAFWRVEGAHQMETVLVHRYRLPGGAAVSDGYGPPYKVSGLTELLASGTPELD